MERKKLIRLAIFIVIIIIGIIVIENSIRGIGTLVENSKEKKEQEKQMEIYKNTETYKETVKLEGVINDFMELFNNNELDTIYDLLDANYKDYKFQNKRELFDDYIKDYINFNSELTLQSYEKVNGNFVCRILAENDGIFKSFIALIIINEETNSYNIIFEDITSIKEENKAMELNNLKYNIKYIITAKQTLIYSLEFTNLGKNDINYTISEVILRDTSLNNFSAKEKNIIVSIKPGETIRKDITFYNGKIHSYPKVSLDFKQKTNNSEETINMYIENAM